MPTTSLHIQGMHCPACARRLTEAFRGVPGVSDARVTLEPPGAWIESDAPVPFALFEASARGAGDYSVSAAPATTESHSGARADPASDEPGTSLYPLALILAFIAGVAGLATFARGSGRMGDFLNDFMAGFFLVFSFFKLLDLRGFADAYASYDLIARRSRAWAFVYPFLELALGVAYLARWRPGATNGATLVLMLLGSIGALGALRRKDRIRCACLGTALNLPMTTVSLVEDLAMAAMAAGALAWPR